MYKLPFWIVVAGNERAHFYLVNKPGGDPRPACDIELVNPHVKTAELAGDREGRTHDRRGPARHKLEPATDPQRYRQQQFAREITAHLQQHHQRGDFRQLYLVASPRMLGELRQAFDDQLTAIVADVLDKDFSKLPLDKIKPQLKRLTRLY